MSNVVLSIGGRSFTVACAEGEEAHIASLGRMIDGKLAAMGSLAGQSEPRMLLFASLLLADELHEARSHQPQPQPSVPFVGADRLGQIAARLENIADHLEAQSTNA